MKKFFFLSLMSSGVILSGCNDSEEYGIITDPIVEPRISLSKVTTVYYDNPANPQTTVETFTYNNNGQLIKTLSGGRSSTFEYNFAGKPIKINHYKTDGTLEYSTSYTYNGEELTNTKAIYSNSDFDRTMTYTYSNGKLATSTLCQSANCTNPSLSSYTYNGENITVETSEIGGTISTSNKHEFLYDNQLNPYSFINKYLKISMGGAYVLSKNNYTTERISYKDSSGNWVQNQHIIYEVQYNSAQLPVQVIGRTSSGTNYVKYNYEYIAE